MATAAKPNWNDHPEVIMTAKRAAIAMALLWDKLRVVEMATGLEFDGTVSMVEDLACDLGVDPQVEEIEDREVIDHLDMLDCQRASRPWTPDHLSKFLSKMLVDSVKQTNEVYRAGIEAGQRTKGNRRV